MEMLPVQQTDGAVHAVLNSTEMHNLNDGMLPYEAEDESDRSPLHHTPTLQWPVDKDTEYDAALSDDAKLKCNNIKLETFDHHDNDFVEFSPSSPAEEEPAEEDEECDQEGHNIMPELAAQVFHPSVLVLSTDSSLRKRKESEAYDFEDSEKQPFLDIHNPPRQVCMQEWPEEMPQRKSDTCCGRHCDCCSYTSLKALASLFGAMLFFPCFLWGGYAFLPFDAPILPEVPMRMVYAFRCAAFATVPIVLGIAVHGISRLCSGSLDPFGDRKQAVEVHRRFVNESVYLFVLFFFNLGVLSTYLHQEILKLVPLLTALFALARLIYWVAFAIGSNFRSFGFGLTFFPIATMLVANLYFMCALELDGLFATKDYEAQTPAPGPKQRFWG
ncbi:TMM79 protein, partial [Polypterus senegalus]